MHCHAISKIFLAITLLIIATVANALETDVGDAATHPESLDCADPVNAARSAIKQTLGPLYANGADQPKLKSAGRQIDQYIADATYCRMTLQSGAVAASQSTIGEWLSLQQWLNRMADTVANSAANIDDNRWRDEYTLFAEIYEFEP